ncbi:helix-turn-helix transcriptional regulator [Domibacillus enclensis]|uniref:AraC family transcriptional regulator n=1 Tax=Domibacillus enclensis TaxID=1017273 RepID=A0A1N6NSF8_9BACI|nr:AraC family transcriptional regulator [Domibacillus enclensis]OXS80131.1 AraC family transcriptional regulator [Domibacillus enclensis]SIP95045.1 AraC-like ligand binding domain-containing protein [Domibacillus enclensis]
MRKQHLLPMFHQFRCLILPESVGLYEKERDHYVDRKAGTWSTFSIHIVIDGHGFVELQGDKHRLSRGDAFLYFPMQEQMYYSSKEEPWSVLWVHFYGEGLNTLLSSRGFHRLSLWHIQDLSPLLHTHEQLLQEAEAHHYLQQQQLSTLTYAFLTAFMIQAEPWSTEKPTDQDNRIQSLLPLMQQQSCEPFELDYWAEKAGVSSYYFCRLFKQAVQMTPMAFITLCRLQQCKQWLLDHEEMKVQDIAEKAGYSSTSYFNKLFLKQEGITPTRYRELHGTALRKR